MNTPSQAFLTICLTVIGLIVVGSLLWRFNFPPIQIPDIPSIPNLKKMKGVKLYLLGLLRGLLIIGKPGVGKTRLLAWIIVEMMKESPQLSVLVLDASGALRKDIVGHILTLSMREKEPLLKRLVIDIPFHPEYACTLPEFSKEYGVPFETQIQRVASNFRKLNPQTMEMGYLGKPMLEEMLPELMRIECALENQHGETYQITESTRLLSDKGQMAIARGLIAQRVPSAYRYFEPYMSTRNVDPQEYEKRTFPLRSCLGVLEAREMRARLGYYKPSYTMSEMEQKGLCVIVSAERMLGHEKEMDYVFTQLFSMFKMHVNQRTPDDPKNTPMMIVFEEAPVLWNIEGMSQETFDLAQFYRSRFVLPVIDIQGTWQTKLVNDVERRKLWAIGNIILMGLDSVKDGEEAMHNIGNYSPTASVNPELGYVGAMPNTAQHELAANWVQMLPPRACVIRRYFNQSQMDNSINFVPKIQDVNVAPPEYINEVTEKIFRSRAVLIRDALDVVNQRELKQQPPTQGRKP